MIVHDINNISIDNYLIYIIKNYIIIYIYLNI
jgi:hypothetical protein